MPELGDSSKQRHSGFSLFKRRQPVRSRSAGTESRLPATRTPQPRQSGSPAASDDRDSNRFNTRLNNSRLNKPAVGSTCQLGEPLSPSSLLDQLFGKRAKTSPEPRSSRTNNSRGANWMGDRESSFGASRSKYSESKSKYSELDRTSEPDRLSSQTTSFEHRSSLARERFNHRRSSESWRDKPTQTTSAATLSVPSVVPLSGRRGRLDRSRQVDSSRQLDGSRQVSRLTARQATQLQPQSTLIQSQTQLQQSTVLQGRDLDRTHRPSRSRRRSEAPRRRSLAIALYAARMLILSVGVGVLAGTVLSGLNPANTPFFGDSAQSIKQASSSGTSLFGKQSPPTQSNSQLSLNQEIAALKPAIQTVAQPYVGLSPGIFLIDLDNSNFLDLSGTTSFSAASMIKVPVLIAFFQDVDAGKIRLDEKLTMTKELIASESGDMQYLPLGAQFTALETATKMITISDNTATNMLIARLGGIAAVNQRFKSWGLTTTIVNSPLPDLKGTNTTSPKELASLMVRVSQGELVSLRSRDRLLDIMRRTINNSQLPQGLGEGATIAHKTGDIGSLIGDVGLVDMPSGKRYAVAVMVKRSTNDDRAYDLTAKISRAIYQHFNSAAVPQRSATPAATSNPASDPNTDAQRQPSSSPNTPERSPMQLSPTQASTQ